MDARAALACLSLILASCSDSHGRDGDASAGADGGSMSYAGAYISPDCAPDDGGALRLQLWDAPVPECSADTARRSLSFYIFQGSSLFFPIEAGETITSSAASGGFGNGSATECPGGTPPCRVSMDWSITFDTFQEDVGASGSYSITFAGGETATGRFDASWCSPGPIVCG